MPALLLVALGGAIGSMARFKVGTIAAQHAAASGFPWGTLAVNLAGCCAIGLLAGYAERASWISTDARLFLMTGVLGGFTTFSAFGLETVSLLRRGDVVLAGGYVTLSVVGGLLAVGVGAAVAGFTAR